MIDYKLPVLKSFLFLLFIIGPFVDTLNGYLISTNVIAEGGIFSPSQLFRLTTLTLSIIILGYWKFDNFRTILFVLFTILIIEFISFFQHENFIGLLLGIIYSSKVLNLFIMYFILQESYKNVTDLSNSLQKITILGALVTGFLLLMSYFLGIGNSTYAEGTFGFKGFFAAGNSLGLFLGTSTIFFACIQPLKTFKSYFNLIILFISTLLVGSKTALAALILTMIIILYKSRYRISISVFTILSGIYYYEPIHKSIRVIYDVILYRFNNSESLFRFLASNRDKYVVDAFSVFLNSDPTLIRLAFGGGVFLSFQDPSQIVVYDTLESDLFDIFFIYGFFGLMIYFTLILKPILISIKSKNYSFLIPLLFILLHSIIAGHVIFNGITGALLVILMFFNQTNNDNIRPSVQ